MQYEETIVGGSELARDMENTNDGDSLLWPLIYAVSEKVQNGQRKHLAMKDN